VKTRQTKRYKNFHRLTCDQTTWSKEETVLVVADSVATNDQRQQWSASQTRWWLSSSRISPTTGFTLSEASMRSLQPVCEQTLFHVLISRW